MKQRFRTTLASLYRSFRRRDRSWVAVCVAVALILPSVGLLPVASAEFAAEAAHVHPGVGESAASHDKAGSDRRERLSDIPGSSTHPVNHDCIPCQVIKYLATSFLPQADMEPSSLAPVGARPFDAEQPPPAIARVELSPPIRAPPSLLL